MMVYEWKQGARVKADAQKVGEELERIAHKDAASIVKAARRATKSELHKCFEWDDSEAAEEYRREQARYLLRMVVVTEESGNADEEPIRYRAFEAVCPATEDDEEPPKAMVYVPTREALSDPEMRLQIMARLEQTIHQAERTAEQYSALVPSLVTTRQKLHEARETVRVS